MAARRPLGTPCAGRVRGGTRRGRHSRSARILTLSAARHGRSRLAGKADHRPHSQGRSPRSCLFRRRARAGGHGNVDGANGRRRHPAHHRSPRPMARFRVASPPAAGRTCAGRPHGRVRYVPRYRPEKPRCAVGHLRGRPHIAMADMAENNHRGPFRLSVPRILRRRTGLGSPCAQRQRSRCVGRDHRGWQTATG